MEPVPVKTDTVQPNITLSMNPLNEIKWQVEVHGDYSSIANCRTKTSTIFLGGGGIWNFRGI